MGFLHAFKMACDKNAIHEGIAMWIIPHPICKTAAAGLTARLSLQSKSSHNCTEEGVLISYGQVVNHLWETYATEEVITERDTDIFRYMQQSTMSPLEFVDALWMNTPICPHV